MDIPIENFAVRIYRDGIGPVGAGVLVANGHIVTCAHVVRDALDIPDDNYSRPDGRVTIDFPWLPEAGRLDAIVKHWKCDLNDVAADIAVLHVDTVPDSCVPAVFSERADLASHEFSAYGYTEGHEQGVWTHGILGLGIASRLVQMTNLHNGGLDVQPGFSGTPVWDSQINAVVGIIVTHDRNLAVRTAFLIPTSLLVETFAGLKESIRTPADESSAVELTLSADPVGPHLITIRETHEGRLMWSGGINPGRMCELWRGRSDFKVAFEPSLNRYRGVADALLRVAIHGSGGSLYVNDPQAWRERSRKAVNKCLGTRWGTVGPYVGENPGDAWSLLPYSEYVDQELPIVNEYTPQALEEIIHDALDRQLLDSISDSLITVLQDANHEVLNLVIEPGLASTMWSVWEEWETLLRSSRKLLGHFLRAIMAKAAPNQHGFARIRAGLQTASNCILPSVVFALAIRACLPTRFIPSIGREHENIRATNGGTGHLCGLELIETMKLSQTISSLSWDTNYVLLPHYCDKGDDIPRLTKSLLNAGGTVNRFDDPMTLSPLYITNESSFARALAEGEDSLKAHLLEVIARWNNRQQTELEHATGGRLDAI